MKKFGRKLGLSGLALAATAATLSTSTYAWYVTNDTANVTGGTAATAGTEVEGNLLVATNDTSPSAEEGQEKGVYSNNIDLGGKFTEVSLNPVTKSTATGEGATGWVNKDGNSVAEANAYQELSFWVLSTKESEIGITTTLKNETAAEDIVKQTCLVKSSAPSGAEVNQLFYVDAAKALRFEVIYKKAVATYNLTSDTERNVNKSYYAKSGEDQNAVYTLDTTTQDVSTLYEATYAAGTQNVSTTYNYEEFSTTYTGLTGALSGGNAHTYYSDIMGGETPDGGTTDPVTAGAEFATLYVAPGVETLITIRVWLDGQDIDCFDSCRGQSFSYDFELKA